MLSLVLGYCMFDVDVEILHFNLGFDCEIFIVHLDV